MTFDEVLARVLDLLQRQGRVPSQALKRGLNSLTPPAAGHAAGGR